jgi:chromosome segregation ATPase
VAEPQTAAPDTAALDAIVANLAGEAPAPVSDSEALAEAIEAAKGEPEAKPAEPAPAPAPEASAAEAKADEAPLDEGSREFKSLARKEKALREEQAAVKAEAEKLAAARAQIAEYEQAKRIAKRDPVAALKALGFDDKQLADAARDIYGATLGDDAPQDWREKRSRRVIESETEDLRAQLEELRASVPKMFEEQRREQQRQSYLSQLQAQLPTVSDGTRFLKKLATKDPAAAARAIYALAEKHANEEGTIPDVGDLAKQLEGRLAEDLGIFLDDEPPAAPKQTPQKAGERNAATLTNKNTATATKPRATPATKDELIGEILDDLKEGRHTLR